MVCIWNPGREIRRARSQRVGGGSRRMRKVRARPGSGAGAGAGLRFNLIAGMKPGGSGGEHDKDYRLEARRCRGCGIACRVGRGSSRFAQNRELAQRRRRHLEQRRSSRPSTSTIPTSRLSSRRPRRKNTTPRSTRALRGEPRATLSPAGPSTLRSISIASTRSTASTTSRAWPIFPMSPSRPGPPTTARRRSACRWRRSSTASSTTRTPSRRSARNRAEDDGGIPRRPR